MATPRENFLSLGQLTGTEWKTFTKQRDQCVKNRVSGPMLLQAELSSLQSHQYFKVTQLQERWQELKEREQRAQQHNKELLQQFEKAQDTFKEMLACTAAMKTIRMEYERYLEESSPRWQQQFKEKTQVAQRMVRTEDYLRSCLKNMEDAEVKKTYKDQYLHSQASIKKPQKFAATQEINSKNIQSDSNQDGSSYYPHVQSSWLTHPQSQTPMRTSHQAQNSLYPSFPPPPHPFLFHHLASMPSFYPWHMQNAPGWSSLQTDARWSLTQGATGLPEAMWSQLYNKEPLPESRVSQDAEQGAETSRASSSKSERCGEIRPSRLSQELDIKPVRLCSGHAESSENSRDHSQMRRKKEKRGSSQCSSSEKESHSSQDSSRTSSAITSAAVGQSSESDASSGKCITSRRKKRKWKSAGKAVESPMMEKVVKEKPMSKKHDSGSLKDASQCAIEESDNQTEESASENVGNSSVDNKSETAREELGVITIQPNNRAGDEKQMQEISCSDQSSAEEKDKEGEHEKGLGEDNAEEKENSQKDDEQEEGDEEEKNGDPEEKEHSVNDKEQEEEYEEDDGEVFAKEEETGAEDEMEVQECEVKTELMNKDCEKRGSAYCQDEEVDDDESEQESEEKTEEDEEGSADHEEGEHEEEEGQQQKSDKESDLEEESDSDSIISTQTNRTHITEEAVEEKENKTQFSDGDDNSNKCSGEDDIEDLLAPQQQKNTKQHLKAAGKHKDALCDKMKIFQVEDDRSTKTDHHSDSDEFDHFYD